ncbi:MAG: hypothetical protein AB9873_09155 [Syntrophobacteraceae bacterium]
MTGIEDRASESFERALLFAFENWSALVVHGWIRSDRPDAPSSLPYAWNELEGNVYDLTQHEQPISKELFYRKHSIRESSIRRYTVQEAACMALGTTSYGPWDAELFGRDK